MIRVILLVLAMQSVASAQLPTPRNEVWVDEIRDMVDDLRSEIAEIRKLVESQPKVSSQACQCDCECPTIDEIRAAVRSEIDRVTITVKTQTGKVETKQVTVKPQSVPSATLMPGDIIVGVNNVPVTPYVYQSQSVGAPVTQYVAPPVEIRTYTQGNRQRVFFRRNVASQSTCYIDANGNRICTPRGR
jgi:hypothetical protein